MLEAYLPRKIDIENWLSPRFGHWLAVMATGQTISRATSSHLLEVASEIVWPVLVSVYWFCIPKSKYGIFLCEYTQKKLKLPWFSVFAADNRDN